MNAKLDKICKEYPLHFYIWHNDYKKLQNLLDTENGKKLIETRDVRGRTPLMLSVSLGHFECAKLLMNAEANVNIDDDQGFNVLHEAIATNDPELVQLVLEKRDFQRSSKRLEAIPILLRKINDTPDFYVEMKWEFTSWIPLISKVCPSDVYKIYKSGSSVRIDTTLSGFEQMSWQRGSRTYIFSASQEGAKFVDIDHDNRQVYIGNMVLSNLAEPINNFFINSPDVIAQAKLTCPTSITYLDTDNIIFERSKSGIIGFRTDRSENVNGFNCKVFTANNVQLITKTRTEHLSEQDKLNYKEQLSSSSIPFQSLLSSVEIVEKNYSDKDNLDNQNNQNYNLSKITIEQYFDKNYVVKNHDIGRPRELTTKINKFKTHLWLSEKFPLSLHEQILPIIDLMAINSSHFSKLRDFITFQIPSGFPVKIEIPILHIVNARITFGNIFSLNTPVEGVVTIKDETSTACVIEESIFRIPNNYSYLGNDDVFTTSNNDDKIYLAVEDYISKNHIQKSNLDFYGQNMDQDNEMQRAIQASLDDYRDLMLNSKSNDKNDLDDISTEQKVLDDNSDDIETAITLSKLEKVKEDCKRLDLEEIYEKVLKISLTEK